MKIILLSFIIAIITTVNIYSQNLVNNPSFENYVFCPYQESQLSAVQNWNIPANTGIASPDYFNECSTNLYSSIPTNYFGSQSAYEGLGYVGIFSISLLGGIYREYIQTQLSSPLVANQNYLISFYVSLADAAYYGTNRIGLYLSQNIVNGTGNYGQLNLTPQITSPSIIVNTSIWTEISGIYHAVGGEEYITIGNFYNNINNPNGIQQLNNPGAHFGEAYFYIDNVSVTATNLSINENIISEVKIYPNPIIDYLNFEFADKSAIKNIAIFSPSGLVYSAELEDKIDLTFLSSGFYYVVITKLDNSKIYRKIVKL